MDFLNFLHEYILPYILKSNKVIFWKIVFCLDNWVDRQIWTKGEICGILTRATLLSVL